MAEHAEPIAAEWSCPADAENVIDGKIKKVVLKEGQGDKPPKHARCLVHYTGRLAESQQVFIDSKEESTTREPAKLIAGRDSVIREACLHLTAATMKPGEHCRIWVDPEYGYGERGSFSFPTVPPNSHLIYDIELLSYDAATEDGEKNARDLTYEERLEAAERRRVEGNDAFRAGNHSLALEKYTTALSYVDEDLLIQLEGFHYDKAMQCRTPVLLNMAAAYRKTGDMHGAIGLCSQVLTTDPENAKALFRRGSARLALGQTEAAIADLQAAKKAEPDDGGISKELAAAQKALAAERKAQKNVFSGVLEKAGGTLYPPVEEKKEEWEEELPEWNEQPQNVGIMSVFQGFWVYLVKIVLALLALFGRGGKSHSA